MEEAKLRDHRKIGKDLKLFMMNDLVGNISNNIGKIFEYAKTNLNTPDNLKKINEITQIIKEKFRDFDYSVFNLGKIEKIKNLYDKIIKMSDKEFLIYADKVKKAGQNG